MATSMWRSRSTNQMVGQTNSKEYYITNLQFRTFLEVWTKMSGQGKNPKLRVSSYFYICGSWVILGKVKLYKSKKVPCLLRILPKIPKFYSFSEFVKAVEIVETSSTKSTNWVISTEGYKKTSPYPTRNQEVQIVQIWEFQQKVSNKDCPVTYYTHESDKIHYLSFHNTLSFHESRCLN